MKLNSFHYQAYDITGTLVSGQLNALDENEALGTLKARQLTPIQLDPIDATHSEQQKTHHLSSEELIHFTEGLTTLIQAQVPIDKALTLLQSLSSRTATHYLIENMIRYVKEGGTLTQAMEDNPQSFSKLYISIVRAGEEGGILADLLVPLKHFLEEAQETKRQIISAMIYPLVLLFVGVLSVVLMILFVVPRFATLFSDTGAPIPASAQFLFSMSDWMLYYSWTLIPASVLLYFLTQWWFRDEQHSKQKDALLLTLPIIGKLLLYKDASNFCRTIGALLSAGVPLIKSLSITQGVLENRQLSAQVSQVELDVKSGLSLGKALEKNTDFPMILAKLIVVGEETGRTANIFNQLAETFNQRVKNRLARLLALIEPLLILLLGILVGGIVIVMLLAVFSMNDIGI